MTGVSGTPGGHGSNIVYQRLRDRGFEVYAVNPNANEVEGDRAYHSLAEIPGGVDAVVIGTRPEIGEQTKRECVDLGIRQVWMHRGPGAGSVSAAAAEFGRSHDVTVIDGGCPCMFGRRPTWVTGSCARSSASRGTSREPSDTPGGTRWCGAFPQP